MDDEGLDGHGNPSSHHLRSPPPPLLPHVILLIPILAILLFEKSTIDGLLQSLPLPHKFHSDDKWTTRKGRWTPRKNKKSGPSCEPSTSAGTRTLLSSDEAHARPPPNPPLHRIILPGANSPANQEIKITKTGEKERAARLSSSALNASGQTFPPCSPTVKMSRPRQMRCKRASLALAQQQPGPPPMLFECGSVVPACRLAVCSA